MKDKTTAYLLMLPAIFGIAGLNRFYLGKIGTGLIWLFTCGLCGFGIVYDLFTTGAQVDDYNLKHRFLHTAAPIQQQSAQQNVVINMPPHYFQQYPPTPPTSGNVT